ncbi:hypothetical protein [Massilia sp. BHUDP2]|uniref:hypothetical protein n=1 Tax=Massilia sp. BHUDP2 TaxID=3034505 RepID=UPI003905DEBC
MQVTHDMTASSPVWLATIVPVVADIASRASSIPLKPAYSVMADLFDPMPWQWGLRGDPFLWMEMAHALCHAPIPIDDTARVRIRPRWSPQQDKYIKEMTMTYLANNARVAEKNRQLIGNEKELFL